MTKEQRKISELNRTKAAEYFNIIGTDLVLHHKDPSWVTADIERYIQWNIEDLIPMTRAEHASIHKKNNQDSMLGKHQSDYQKQRAREVRLGIKVSDETKKKLSESHKGKRWKVLDGKRTYY